jgi:hypothetical protein
MYKNVIRNKILIFCSSVNLNFLMEILGVISVSRKLGSGCTLLHGVKKL